MDTGSVLFKEDDFLNVPSTTFLFCLYLSAFKETDTGIL